MHILYRKYIILFYKKLHSFTEIALFVSAENAAETKRWQWTIISKEATSQQSHIMSSSKPPLLSSYSQLKLALFFQLSKLLQESSISSIQLRFQKCSIFVSELQWTTKYTVAVYHFFLRFECNIMSDVEDEEEFLGKQFFVYIFIKICSIAIFL